VPKNYFPAVEKGLREAILHGVIAGYPMVGLKATLLDGSYHPVDSSEMAFKLAAALAYKAAIPQGAPVLLEPVGALTVTVPENAMGDVIGEINKRRGRVLGMDHIEGGCDILQVEAPMAELHDFSTVLRSVTQGRGSFTLTFSRYEDAPPQVAQARAAQSHATQAAGEKSALRPEQQAG
jgi:elongation factor G